MSKQLSDEAFADTQRGLIPEDLLKFRWLTEIAMAPDGNAVAYTVRQPDATTNSYQTDVYLLDLERRTTYKLTEGRGQGTSPAWSRDGSRLAYVWRSDTETRIETVAADGTPEQSYLVQGDVPQDLDWAPDGRRLAYACWTKMCREEEHDVRPDVPSPSVRVVRRLRYKQDGVGWVHDRYRQIWVLELGTGDLTQVTDNECDYREPRWSWDGQRIAFVAVDREQNTPLGQGQILIYDYTRGQIERLMPAWEGAAVSPQWRADDEAIVFAGYADAPPVNRRIFYHVWLYEFEGGQAHELTGELDQTVGNYAVSDQRAGLTNVTVKWPGGRGLIYFLLTEQGATHLYSVTETGAWQCEVDGQCVVFEYAPSESGPVAYGQANPRSNGELYLLKNGTSEQLTHLNPWLDSHKLATPREYWYEGLDGAQVHAWEMKPVGFEKDQQYPAIVYVHCSMFSWDFSHEFQCLANAGYAVAYFNQRGTTAGYGQDHALGNYYGKHVAEFEEIMLGVDNLIERSYVDESRLGVTGGSCGGFMTNWIVGHTDRFTAAVTQRSVTDLVSKYGTSDNGPEQAESEGGGAPWRNIERLWRSSPIAYAPRIRTPLLIIHAEQDHRCALDQAEEMFAALRWLGRPVELVVFEEESHGLSRGGRPGNRIERLRRILRWFDRYLC